MLSILIKEQRINCEIIIIDDGLSDDGVKIITHYQLLNKRIKLFHQQNKGQSAARNVGIDAACDRVEMNVIHVLLLTVK